MELYFSEVLKRIYDEQYRNELRTTELKVLLELFIQTMEPKTKTDFNGNKQVYNLQRLICFNRKEDASSFNIAMNGGRIDVTMNENHRDIDLSCYIHIFNDYYLIKTVSSLDDVVDMVLFQLDMLEYIDKRRMNPLYAVHYMNNIYNELLVEYDNALEYIQDVYNTFREYTLPDGVTLENEKCDRFFFIAMEGGYIKVSYPSNSDNWLNLYLYIDSFEEYYLEVGIKNVVELLDIIQFMCQLLSHTYRITIPTILINKNFIAENLLKCIQTTTQTIQ
jgi:hypothetical protein